MCQKYILIVIILIVTISDVLSIFLNYHQNYEGIPVKQQIARDAINPEKSLFAKLFDSLEADVPVYGLPFSNRQIRAIKQHIRRKKETLPKVWDRWSKWSACSVSCGVGKVTRWRHCIAGGCARGEKEAQIKTCTLPEC